MEYNFINNKYVVDFEVPEGLKELIDKAEEADKNNKIGDYAAYIEMIETVAKNCCACGSITKKQWDIISYRYV